VHTPQRHRSDLWHQPGPVWCALCAALALLSVLLAGLVGLGALKAQWLDWQPQLALAQPWRAFTAALLHWSPMHLWANIGSLFIVAALGWVAEVPRALTGAALAAWPLTQLGLLLQPELQHYAGLSGWLYAAIGVVIVHLVWNRAGTPRWIGIGIGIALGIKLAAEQAWMQPLQVMAGWDIAIAPAAHASGTAMGVMLAALITAAHRRGPARSGARLAPRH
jgi:rhomboid family GlyGly-CTERM serine protease